MFNLGDKYLNCLMVYQNGKVFLPEYENITKQYIHYVDNFSRGTINWNDVSIWCDLTMEKVDRLTGHPWDHLSSLSNLFSSEQYRETPFGKNHTFSASKDSWLSSKWTQKKFISDNLPHKKIIQNSEIVINPSPDFEDLKGKSVLIVGGGPSTRDCSWEKVADKFDFIWSSNEFYLNSKLQNKLVSFSTMASCYDLINNNVIIDYINNKNLKMWLEVERGDDPKQWEYLKQFANKYPSSCGVFNSRWRSNHGVGNRMVILAIMLGASEIGIVGIDGARGFEANLEHSFNGKKELPNWMKLYGKDSHRLQERQYLIYWEYICKLQKFYNFKIFNLGESHPSNVSKHFTSKLFPLGKDIKDVMTNEYV